MAYKNWIKSVTYYVCCNVTKRPLHFNYSDTISCCQQPADLLVCIISHWCYCKFRSLVIAHYFFRFQARLLLFWMIKYVSNIIFDTNKRTNRKQSDKRADARNRIWCILALKCDIWWQYFDDFPDIQLTKVRVFIGRFHLIFERHEETRGFWATAAPLELIETRLRQRWCHVV